MRKIMMAHLLVLLAGCAVVKADWQMGVKFSVTNLFGPGNLHWGPICTFKGGEGLWAKGREAWAWVSAPGKVVWVANSNILESTLTFGAQRELWLNRDSLFLVDIRDNLSAGYDVVMRRVTREGIQDMLTRDGWKYSTGSASIAKNRKVLETGPYIEDGIWLRRDVYPQTWITVYDDIEWEFWTWVSPDSPLVVLTAVVTDGEVGVSWLAEIGRTYQVQVTSDLQAWEDHGDRIFGDNTHARVVMVDPGCRLVRVIAFE